MTTRFDASIRAFLTHRWTMALKSSARNGFWRLRGIGIRNPRLPEAPRSFLFVCKGNICRSPFAALLAGRLFARRGHPEMDCRSAGFAASTGGASPEAALEAAAGFGVSLREHRPAALTREMVEEADVVIAMEGTHLSMLRRMYPHRRDRFFLLPLFAPVEGETQKAYLRYNIADPYGKSPQVFDQCYRRIQSAVVELVLNASSRQLAG
jgi:protein-tyrosine phosphatase